MAITTEDGIVAGLKPPAVLMKNAFTGEAAGFWHDLGLVAGNPGVRTLGAPGMAGATVSANALGGALPFDNPASGNAYLARLAAAVGGNVIALMFYDLLWYQTGIAEATLTAQTVNSVALPARDKAGTTNGDGVEAWLIATTATTNAGAIANTSLSYTNEAGTAGRTANLVQSWPATAVAGTAVPFGLQGSDRGVRSIQSVTLGTSYVGGQVDLYMLRQLALVPFISASSGALLDWAALGLPQLHNNSAVYAMALLSGTAGGAINAHANFSHG